MRKKICIFCAPATQEHIVKTFSDTTALFLFQPPAEQGDIWRNIREDVGAIILADKPEKSQSPLWQKEIIDALRVHIHVIDTGTLDAETAAKLEEHGLETIPTPTPTDTATNQASAIAPQLQRVTAAVQHTVYAGNIDEQSACGTFATALAEYQWRKHALNLRPCIVQGQTVRGAEIIHHFLKFSIPDALAEIATKMYATFYTLEWAKLTGTTCPDDIRKSVLAREESHLKDTAWLLSNGIVQCEYASLLEQEALLHHLSSSPWQTYVEAWANKAGIIIPELPANMSTYQWIISKNPSLFGYTWEYEVGLWDWLQRNKRVSDIATSVLAIKSNQSARKKTSHT